MSANPNYTSSSQQVLLRVIEALAVDPLTPTPVARVVRAVNCHDCDDMSRDQVFRALQNLALADWAGEIPDAGWRLSPRAVRLSEQFRLAISDAHRVYLAGCPGVLDPDDEPEEVRAGTAAEVGLP